MKILITGANGQVGAALVKILYEHHVIPITKSDCDLKEINQIKKVIDYHKPDLIINSAAYTNVDQAESEKEIAFLINCDAPKVMAEKALELNIPFIHLSTDYVFDGMKEGSYSETDQANPLNIYGKSKLGGDRAVQEIGGKFYIFRTSWVYSQIGKNFFLTIKKRIGNKNQLRVVSDQFGVPTSNFFIAKVINNIIDQLSLENVGLYNLVPNGKCSWYDFAQIIKSKIYPDFDSHKLTPIKTRDLIQKAERPKNSVLNNNKIQSTFMIEFENWEFELDQIINET